MNRNVLNSMGKSGVFHLRLSNQVLDLGKSQISSIGLNLLLIENITIFTSKWLSKSYPGSSSHCHQQSLQKSNIFQMTQLFFSSLTFCSNRDQLDSFTCDEIKGFVDIGNFVESKMLKITTWGVKMHCFVF